MGKPCPGVDIGSLKIWILSSSKLDPRSPGRSQRRASALLWSKWAGPKRSGERKRWFLSVGSFHLVGKVWSDRGSQSNLTREARALHMSPRKIEDRRHSPCIPGLTVWRKTCFFNPGHRLPHPSPTISGIKATNTALDHGKTWDEPDPRAFSCVLAWSQGLLLQPFLSELSAPGDLRLWPGPVALLGGWLAVRAAVIRPTFPFPPGALGA